MSGPLIRLGALVIEPGRRRWGTARPLAATNVGLRGTRGFHLAWWGMIITILAAPIDDLWHRLFGLDVTIWSPPHLMGILGAVINAWACLVIAREVYPEGGGARLAAMIQIGRASCRERV